MDSGICRTSYGKLCEKGLKRGGKCTQHGGAPSPKKPSSRTSSRVSSPKSPKRSASPKKEC